jgi:hypothetical protein
MNVDVGPDIRKSTCVAGNELFDTIICVERIKAVDGRESPALFATCQLMR